MTQGCRRSCESCLTSSPCGILDGWNTVPYYAGFCCTDTNDCPGAGGSPDSECPSTLNISFTLPEYQSWVCCDDPIAAYHLWTVPASSKSISISYCGSDTDCSGAWGGQCVYYGNTTNQINVRTNNVCSYGRNNISSQTTTVYLNSNGYQTYPWWIHGRSPCADNGDTAPEDTQKCCGTIVTILDGGRNSGGDTMYVRYFQYAFRNNFIDDCGTPCPCYEEYVSGQGHYKGRFPNAEPSCYAQQLPEFFSIEVS